MTGASGTDIRAILFDKDGTLIDFDRTWFGICSELASRSAEGDPKLARDLLEIGGYDWQAGRFRAGSLIAAGTIAEIVAHWHPDATPEENAARIESYDEYSVREAARRSVGLDGLGATLTRLNEMGFILGVATNDSEAGARGTMAALELTHHFRSIQGFDSVERPKPYPDMLLRFAREAGVDPKQVAMVGDNSHDLEMARSAGAGLAIGVLSGNSREEDLAPLADAVLPSLVDLPAFLSRK